MKISLLSSRFPPQRCGVGDYTCFLASALAKAGHDVDVLTVRGDLDEALYPLEGGARVHRVVPSWGIARLGDVINQIRRIEPEVLLIQYTPHAFDRRGMTLAINLLPALLRLRGSLQVVTNFHELFVSFNGSVKRRVSSTWQRSSAMLLAHGSHALTTTATEWKRRLERLHVGKPVHVIPVGSNIPKANLTEEEKERLRRHVLGTSDGLLLVGFGAKHDRNVPAILAGLSRLKSEQRAKLVWIGGGSPNEVHRVAIAEAIRRFGLTEEDLEWTGVIPHPQVSKLLSACDLVLLPFTDGISTRRTTAVTALQHGLPLLTTYGPEPEPGFLHRRNAYMVPCAQEGAVEDGMLDLARDRDLRAQLARGALELYDAHFSWSVIADQVSRLALARK